MTKPGDRGDDLVLSSKARVQLGDVIITDCLVAPCPGIPVGGSLFTVTMSRGPAQRFFWRNPGSDRLQSQMVVPGSAFIDAAGEPLWARWHEPASMFIVALKHDFPAKLAMELELKSGALTTQRGIDDQIIRYFASLFEQELAIEGASGRLYLESLTEALTINLLHRYAEQRSEIRRARGGLSPALLRRVLDYIEAHLGDEIGLRELANLVGLSTHYFGQAFKASVGMAPYRYVLERRVERARQLLAAQNWPIVDIATEVGFANQSHLTFNFRRVVGTTPARFRTSVLGLPSRPLPSRR